MITLTREEAQQVLDALETLAKYEHPEHKIQIRKPKNGGHIVTVYPHKLATDGAEILNRALVKPDAEPLAWLNFNAATGDKNVSFVCESEIASIPLFEHLTAVCDCQAKDMPFGRCCKVLASKETISLDEDEIFDAAASAYCRSDASRGALRLCWQSRNSSSQVSIGWTANELMDFAKVVASICIANPAAPVQKPVAWMHPEWRTYKRAPTPTVCYKENWVPLYLHPPQRKEWQGLTDEEITALKHNGERYISSQDFARAIEAALRAKNT